MSQAGLEPMAGVRPADNLEKRMFAGHVGMALALGRAERRVNVGILVTGALLLDIVLWIFVLVGWESVSIPVDYASTHQPEFEFPYSHGLAASLLWSALAAAGAWAACSRRGPTRARTGIVVAAAVFSHWLLDALVHRPELPLLGATSPAVGLSLWNRTTFALVVEAAIVVLGIILFAVGSGLPNARKVAVSVLSLAILSLTIVGMTIAPPPPTAPAMAGSSLLTVVAVCAVFGWLGRGTRGGPGDGRQVPP